MPSAWPLDYGRSESNLRRNEARGRFDYAGNQPQEALKPEAKTRTRPAQRLPTSKTCPHAVVNFTVAGLLGAVVFPLLLQGAILHPFTLHETLKSLYKRVWVFPMQEEDVVYVACLAMIADIDIL